MSSQDLTVLALPGSIRAASTNRLLLEAAAASAPPGMTVSVYRDLSSVPLFSEDLEAALPPPVGRLRDAVASARGLLISTPEYNQSIPGVLKNAIDWISRSEEILDGKPVAIIGATVGRWGTRLAQSALRQALQATGALILPGPAMFVADAGRLFDGDRLIDPTVRDQLEAVLAGFERWIRTTAAWSRPRPPSGAS